MTINKNHKAILFCGTFLIIILVTKGKNMVYAHWIFGTLFSGLILFYSSRQLNLFGKFRRTDNNLWQRDSKQDFQKRLEDDGIFTYENTKFSFPFFDHTKKYNWADIKTLIAYKEDLNTYDEIYLRILFTDKQVFLINETTAGWYKFIRLLKENIPTISANWDYDITLPAFATNMTVLFDKENRGTKIAIKDSYNE